MIFVVAGDETHRHEVKQALLSYYNVIEFDTSTAMFTGLKEVHPALIIIAEKTPPRDGFECTRELRTKRDTNDIPILIILDSDSPVKAFAAAECRANKWLAKPYLRSLLIKTISGMLNFAVEREWEALPPIQARALKETVETFNSIADNIAAGTPISYKEVTNACIPLIEAVHSGNFSGILEGVKHHDNYTYVHSLRVATMLTLFGHVINLPPNEQKLLTAGGLLHDVGKMTIPHSVLNKPGKLHIDEFAVMKGHVTASVHQLELTENLPRGIITIAGQHHEKLDGTGYPYGLQGTELNELARMASIVDIFSALTDRRCYKDPMLPEEALAIMIDQMGRQIDIRMLNMFRERFLDALSSIGS
jgi:putative nucleotidyltransferase with HDIG domain